MDESFEIERRLRELKKYRRTMFGKLTREEWQAMKRQRAKLRIGLDFCRGNAFKHIQMSFGGTVLMPNDVTKKFLCANFE